MFLEQEIGILETFLKNHETLKTGVMMLKIQLCITVINYILKIFKVKSVIFDQINAALVRERLLSNIYKKSY